MGFYEINLMIRAGTMALLILMVAILFRDHRRALPARLAMAIVFGVACHLIFEMPKQYMSVHSSDWIFFAGESSMFGCFWLFARAWFDDETRIGWPSWLIVLATIGLSLANFGINARSLTVYWPLDIAMRLVWVGLPILGLWVAWRGRGNDLVEARRKLRTGFVRIIGSALVLITMFFFVANLVIDRQADFNIIWIIVESSILLITGTLCTALFGSRQADLFAAVVALDPVQPAPDDPVITALAERLHAHMAYSRVYRTDGLTIAALAAQLGEQEYRLRRLINTRLGHRNFAAFLNSYRLDEVREALADPAQRDVPILTIALDAGFGSLAPFNRAFRDAEGVTPSEYRQKKR